MMKILLPVIGLFLVLTSCKKTKFEGDPTKDFHGVKFTMSISDQNILEPSSTSLPPAADPKTVAKLSDYFDKLEYYLYNSRGTRLANQNMEADQSAIGFKIPTISLPSGTYTVVFLGRREKSNGHSAQIYFGDDQGNPYLAHSIPREVCDLFYSSQEFEVKDKDTQIDVALRRPGGKFKVIIEDDTTAHFERIEMLVNGYTLFYPKSDNLAQKKDISLSILKNYLTSFESVNGVSVPKQTYIDRSYENFVFTNSANATSVNATIVAYDGANNLLTQKTLNNIVVERNKTTTVKLKLSQ
ncbi:FimB/Mfa2 family fimbrial subunit [Arcticibacter pallidicorallinus]|nr:FimB/Mfa2 family fimbrial subunit [Arcticibacter pallidicorallinus]